MANFTLLRSKQSEDVAALSIVHNKNAGSIETELDRIDVVQKKLLQDFQNLLTKIEQSVISLGIDLSIVADSQIVKDVFSVVISKASVNAKQTTYQIYITNLDSSANLDFQSKLYKLLLNEFQLSPTVIRLTANSATFTVLLNNSDIATTSILNLYIHS